MATLKLFFGAVGITLALLLQTFPAVSSSSSSSSGKILSRNIRQDDHHDHEEGEYFVEVGNFLLEEELASSRIAGDFEDNHDQNITSEQTGILVSTLFSRVGCEDRFENCSKCAGDFVTDLFAALSVDQAHGLSEESFAEATPRLLFAVYQIDAVCSAGPGGPRVDLDEDVVLGALMSAGEDGANSTLSEDDLEEILHEIEENYVSTTQAMCFDVEYVFEAKVADHEAGADEEEAHGVSASVITSILHGHCIGEASLPDAEAFTDSIFDTYAHDGVIEEEDFEEMLGVIGIGGVADHAAEAEAAHDHRRRRAAVRLVSGVGSGSMSRAKRAANEHDHGHEPAEGTNVSATCFTGEQLLDIFGVDHESGITETQFNSMAPSLLQQMLSGVCALTDEHSAAQSLTNAEVWGYATLAVLVVSLAAVVGAIFIPCMSGFFYQAFIQTMIALAVATLTGDALLHLIPQAVGLHAHDAAAHDHATVHGPSNPELAYVWKCLVVEAAIYAFFLFEAASGFISCGSHSHSHGPKMEMNEKDLTRTNSAIAYRKSKHSESKSELTSNGYIDEEEQIKRPRISGCSATSFMIILGDSVHNFGDGLAIGAAFSTSIGAGISTSVAVFCHELPHELGDLAVLLNQGMKLSTAICLNFISACVAFAGAWVGIPLAQSAAAREWIFAAAAGMFLYVGLVSMMPLLHAYRGKHRGFIFFLQNIGFLIGAGIILVIAFYEDAITITV